MKNVRSLGAAAAATALLVSACSGGGDSGGGSSPTGSSGSSGGSAASGSGSAQASSSAARPANLPSSGEFTSAVATALGRSTVPDAQVPASAVGTWRGTKVAVLASGEDATLLVRTGSAWKIVGGWWPSKDLPGPYLGGKRHVLMLGSDAREGQNLERTRADAIQLLGVDGAEGAGVLGIPRDTWTTLPSGKQGRVNSAMPAGGPTAMTKAVSSMTGIPVSGYIVTSFGGFTSAVNRLGGITVTLKSPVRDLKPGTQKLNGQDALWLARERKSLPGGDLDRSANQGLVLMSTVVTMRQKGVGFLPQLMTVVGPRVRTDLSAAQVLTLFAHTYALNPTQVGRQVTPVQPKTIGGASEVTLKPSAKDVFARFRDGNL
ncbi:LCP family protein [Dermacoccaceae bacterium W4C1]